MDFSSRSDAWQVILYSVSSARLALLFCSHLICKFREKKIKIFRDKSKKMHRDNISQSLNNDIECVENIFYLLFFYK